MGLDSRRGITSFERMETNGKNRTDERVETRRMSQTDFGADSKYSPCDCSPEPCTHNSEIGPMNIMSEDG